MSLLTLDIEIRDLHERDLPGLDWSGGPGHVKAIASHLSRVPAGLSDYLVACVPSGKTVGKGGITYDEVPGAGVLIQFSVLEALQSCGIGTALIHACEDRVRDRGLTYAEIAVEENDPRPARLYARLGYEHYDTRPASWSQERPDGSVVVYETTLLWMRRSL